MDNLTVTDPVEDSGEFPVLSAPAEPLPPVVSNEAALRKAVAALEAGSGPVAVDAERAQSYRYSARAYLIQLRRSGAGTLLLDPARLAAPGELADLTPLSTAIEGAEWIIHAANQDLPCLVEVGMVPHRIFDTELAGRLLGLPKVGLGALIEKYFGLRLLKEHSAADWSARPIPEDWLNYAALDVELLAGLRDILAEELDEAGKTEWARQEFDWLTRMAGEPLPRRRDPWRRTSGIHSVRSPLGLAVVREIWQARDEIAARLDRAPGRILPDRAIAELATLVKPDQPKPSRTELRSIRGLQRRSAQRFESNWLDALDDAYALSKSDLPPVHLPTDGPPHPRAWESRNPEAYARHQRMRDVMTELATEHHLPAENLLKPDFWRRLAWEPPEVIDPESVNHFLAELGARPWQREIVSEPLAVAAAPEHSAASGNSSTGSLS